MRIQGLNMVHFPWCFIVTTLQHCNNEVLLFQNKINFPSYKVEKVILF